MLNIYGQVDKNCLKHINEVIFEKKYNDQIPSIMMLLINLKKSQEYLKHLKNTHAGFLTEKKINSILELLKKKCLNIKNQDQI